MGNNIKKYTTNNKKHFNYPMSIQVKYYLDTKNYNRDKIKTKIYTNPNNLSYKILNYDEKVTCDNDATNGLYRSVVLSHPENNILCYSPPKSYTLDYFKEANPDFNSLDILANEIIEGTMISLFYDPRINCWEIATKGAICGNYWFYRTQYDNEETPQKTFRQMFLEALRASELNGFVGFEDFSKDYCYNFVLQHPDNHIVLNIEHPVLYLVSVYHIVDNVVVNIPQVIYEEWDCFLGLRGLIEFPKHLEDETITSYESLTEKYCCSHSNSHHVMGYMIHQLSNGMRTLVMNPVYEKVRELRGNNTNLYYHYLCLKRMNKVKNFLSYFPQYKSVFYRFYLQYEDFISNLHQSYISYYVKKNGVKISKKYFPLIYKLHHNVYLPSLASGEKIIMRRSEIKKRLNDLSVSELFYYLQSSTEDVYGRG